MNWTTQTFLTVEGAQINFLVLEKLRKAGNRGVTIKDFAPGYRLSAYIGDLRLFANVSNVGEPIFSTCGRRIGTRARYVLDSEFPSGKRRFGTKNIQLRYNKGKLQYKV